MRVSAIPPAAAARQIDRTLQERTHESKVKSPAPVVGTTALATVAPGAPPKPRHDGMLDITV